jgi:ribosomal protein S18 acetylase RimI-like enzyme
VLQLVIKERRVLCATLHVDVNNSPALALYRNAGFLEVSSLMIGTRGSLAC